MGVIKKLPVYSEKIPGGGIVVTSLEQVLNFAQAKSLWYLLFGTACCAPVLRISILTGLA